MIRWGFLNMAREKKAGQAIRIGLMFMAFLSAPTACLAKTIQNPSPAASSQEDDSGSTSRLLSTICDQVMEHHISPPTRQQLYLSSVKALYVANRAAPPSELGEQFSKLTSEKDFEKAVVTAWCGVAKLPDFDALQSSRAAATGMLLTGTSNYRFMARTDSFSRFISAKDFRVQQQLAENLYVGIGIQLKYEAGLPQITEAFFGGAARKAGAGTGDWILNIDGWQTQDQSFQEIVDRLRGPKGSRVVVIVRNKDASDDKTRTYEMIRNVIPLTTVQGTNRRDDGSWDVTAEANKSVAILKFNSIVGSTAAEAADLARQIDHESIQSVILDFRGVYSADLHNVTMLADVLLGEANLGDVISRDSTSTIRLRPDMQLRDKRLVILADQFVGGELFMMLSALREYRGAQFVGKGIWSDAACTKSIELADGLGAIDNLVYATCVPNAKSTVVNGDERAGEDLLLSSPLTMRPDVAVSGGPEEIMNAAMKAAQADPKVAVPVGQSKGKQP